jgi:hypothetical protein
MRMLLQRKSLLLQMHSGLRLMAILILPVISFAEINDVFLSFQGYSGIINVPNAAVLPDGHFSFLFNNQTPPNLESAYPNSFFKNFIATIGIFPYTEITARFMNASPSGPRDLSADIKFSYAFSRFGKWLPSIGGGVQDISGGAVFLSTKYLVMSEEIRHLRLSIGYGTGPNRMEGVFYGIEYFLSKYLQILFDNDVEQTSGAVRFSTANNLSGEPLSMAFVIKSVFKEKTPEFTFSASLSYDLKKRDNLATQHATEKPDIGNIDTICNSNPAELDKSLFAGIIYSKRVDNSATVTKDGNSSTDLQMRLLSCGLENISVNTQSDKIFIRYENNRFGQNEMDALGIVLGAASEINDSTIDTIHITMLQSQVPVITVEVGKKDYCRFIETNDVGTAQLKIYRKLNTEEHAFHTTLSGRTTGKIRCEISPRLRYFLGTEVGAFDYQASLNFDSFMDLWPGASIGARAVLPIWNTENFDAGNSFAYYKEKCHLNSASLFQFMNLGSGITSLFSTGYYNAKYFSIVNDLRFTNKNGMFKMGVNGGYYTANGYYRTTCLPYIGLNIPIDISVLITGGVFWEQDKGFDISIIRSFNSVDLILFYKHTKNVFNYFDTFIGSQINIPLCFKKGMKPHFITIAGKNDWHTSISTRVAEKGSLNYISTSCGVIPEMLVSQDNDFFNRNRLDNRYIKENISKLREAWLENRLN